MSRIALHLRLLSALAVLSLVALTGCAAARGPFASVRSGAPSTASTTADVPAPQLPQIASSASDYRNQLTSYTSDSRPASPNRRVRC